MLKARLLRKQLGDHMVLKELNLDIEDGSIFGLIGANGAGKSTLLRVLAGIYEPDLGCATIDDENIYDDPMKKQDILLIGDNPYYFFNATLKDMKNFYKMNYPNLDEEVYHDLIRNFSLDENKSIQNFSKGMKRQAFIILGLAIAPKYLLLDEAFDGLDPRMRLLFKRAITSRIEEKKMTVVISSHNLKEMENICDSFGILENGQVLTAGSMRETLDQIHKVQLAFSHVMAEETFASFLPLSLRIDSCVVKLVVKGNIDIIQAKLEELKPLMMEVVPVSLEEVFVYEMERRGDKK